MMGWFTEGLGRLAAAAAIALWVTTVAAQAESGPFSRLAGQWNGSGQIQLSNGTKERIRCRASYRVGSSGTAMQQALRCASDSYNFELRSDVESRGSEISGNWSELTRNIGGELTGKARRGRIDVVVKGGAFDAELILVTDGNRQTVTIRSNGTQFSGAKITLQRRS